MADFDGILFGNQVALAQILIEYKREDLYSRIGKFPDEAKRAFFDQITRRYLAYTHHDDLAAYIKQNSVPSYITIVEELLSENPYDGFHPSELEGSLPQNHSLTSPSYYDTDDSGPMPQYAQSPYTNYSVTQTTLIRCPPPGLLMTCIRKFHGDGPVDWKEQARDLLLVEERRFGKIGLHCYNLEKGTNLQFLGLHKSRLTGIGTQKITFEAEDPIRCCTHRFETHLYARKHKDFLTVITTTVPPAPEEEGDCCCFSILAANDDSLKGVDMPDWLHEDASNKLQYYEMKESEVEEHKEWLHVYAELALLSKLKDYKLKLSFELGKIIVQSRQIVEPKKMMVKAEDAIFYMSFKSSDGQDYNGIIRRTRVGRPGEKRLSLECKVSYPN